MNKKFKKYLSSSLLIFFCSCAAKTHHTAIEDPSVFQNQNIRTLIADAKVQVETSKKIQRFQANILVEPDSFYIEIYGFGVPQANASFRNGRLTIVSSSERAVYNGGKDSSLRNFLGVDVTPAELVKLLLIQKTDKSVEYGQISRQDHGTYPKSIKTFVEGGVVTLEFKEVKINDLIASKSFQIDIPDQGFHVYSIDSL